MDSGLMGQRSLNRDLLVFIQLGEINGRSDAEVGAALLRLAHDELEAFGTDGQQRTSEEEMRHILQTCRRLTKRIGVDLDLPFSDYRTFKSHWRVNGAVGSWRARRKILNDLFEPLHQELARLEDAADLPAPDGSTEVSPRSRPETSAIGDHSSAADDARSERNWDIFISYATEDKETVATPLANALQGLGFSVWYDDFELQIGDNLRESIDRGIAHSRVGLVILSKPFFGKDWTKYELDGLVVQANNADKPLLPIWHEISKDEVIAYSAPLAGIVALRTADFGIDEIANRIARRLRPDAALES